MARNAMHLARQETLLPWPARKIDRSGSLDRGRKWRSIGMSGYQRVNSKD
jgi:hypothetical protein